MHQTLIAQRFQIFVADVESFFGVRSAQKIAEALLRVMIDHLKAFVGVDHREEPSAPCQLVLRKLLRALLFTFDITFDNFSILIFMIQAFTH